MHFSRRMRPLSISKIRVTDPFWSRWQRVLIETTLPHEYAHLTTRLENLRRAGNGETGGFVGFPFDDTDVYKWAEACAYALAATTATEEERSRLLGMLDEAIGLVQRAQREDGYLDTYIQLNYPDGVWRNLNALHEMYCAGHLIEAAVALSECLGDRRLLDVALRFVDHIMSVFGPEGRLGYCGHEELELALVRLSAHTGEPKYRDFARWQVESRGRRPSPFQAEIADPEAVAMSIWGCRDIDNAPYSGEYCQDHAPIREHDAVVGHAVRAMYLYIAAADPADGQEDAALETALRKAWDSIVKRRMYVTGGIGPSAKNEGFTQDFDLPNLTSYAETCAAIGLALWGQKMLEMTADGEYGEIIERALYNGALAGISLSGDRFFYDNPHESRGGHERKPWFACACCPPNIARLIGNLGSMVAGEGEDAFYINQLVGFEAETRFGRIKMEGDWRGTLRIQVDPTTSEEFAIWLRIPAWAEGVNADLENGYLVFRRVWKAGDSLTIELGAKPRWVGADPRVQENLGRAALAYGPLVYCLEEKDLGLSPGRFSAETNASIEPRADDRLEGVTVLPVSGMADMDTGQDALYAPLDTRETRPVVAEFIPYYAWANRGPNGMQVWVRRTDVEVG